MLVVTRAQLLAEGLTPDHIDAQLRARRWRALNERVLSRHNGPLTRREALAAALWSARPPSALCGLTALEVGGLRGHEDRRVHVVVRRGAKPLAVSGVETEIHESRRFTVADTVTIGELVTTDVHRAVVDACAWAEDLKLAARILVDSVQQRLSIARPADRGARRGWANPACAPAALAVERHLRRR